MKFSFDIRDPKLWKSAAVSLIWIAFFALLSVFLTNVLFGVALRRVLDSIEYHGGGKQKVQLVLEGVSYLAFFVCVSVSAFLRGKRRSKRVKASKEIFLRGFFRLSRGKMQQVLKVRQELLRLQKLKTANKQEKQVDKFQFLRVQECLKAEFDRTRQ